MIPTKLAVNTCKAPDGVEYWPNNEREMFVKNFEVLFLSRMRGFEMMDLGLLALRYETSMNPTEQDKLIEKQRIGSVRYWYEQMLARSCRIHSQDRDLQQYAASLTINEVECYVYPLDLMKRFAGYDEVVFQIIVKPLKD